MKKSKFLIGILVLAVMLMGAGYAAWTQSFVIEATVDAGEMSLLVDAIDAISPLDTGNYITESCEKIAATADTKDKIEATITNIYPGQHTIFGLSVKNTGTMGIKLQDSMFDNSDLLQKFAVEDPDSTTTPKANLESIDGGIDVEYYIHTPDGTTIDFTTVDWLEPSELLSALDADVLAPQEVQEVYVKISMPMSTSDTFENTALRYSVDVEYIQTANPADQDDLDDLDD